MSEELTAAQVAERLSVGRSTVNLWCRQGLFPGARREHSPVGVYWLIPESALKSFQKPQPGRPPKPKDEAEKSVAKKRARKKDSTRLLKTLS